MAFWTNTKMFMRNQSGMLQQPSIYIMRELTYHILNLLWRDNNSHTTGSLKRLLVQRILRMALHKV